MDILRKHNIGLNKDDNTKYYDLVETYNVLGRKIVFINEKIIKLKQPTFFIFCQYYRIKSFITIMEKLQVQVDRWSGMYNDFIQRPSLTFSGSEERELGFLHYIRLLEQMDRKITDLFALSASHFIKIQERNSNQINFLIAILSAFLSITGLILALITMKLL